MSRKWKEISQLEHGLRNLPEKNPPAGFRANVMAALPVRKEPWFERVPRIVSTWWLESAPVFRGAIVAASLVLTFYGGTQFDNLLQDKVDISAGTEVAQANMSDEAYFYLGRSLLASDRAAGALEAFRQAEMLQPDNPRYMLWQGAAYQALGDSDQERRSYQRVISRRPELLPARLNLAHNLLQSGQALQAGQLYEQVLARNPTEKTALYNQALAYRLQGNPGAEVLAWKNYLDYYRMGTNANRALKHLQELGDYSYRSYQIGYKSVILNQDRLLDIKSPEQLREIDYLVRHVSSRSLAELNIVVFVEGDVQQAKKVASSLRKAIADQVVEKDKTIVRISWFGDAEPIETINKDQINQSEGVLIFGSLKLNEDMGERV